MSIVWRSLASVLAVSRMTAAFVAATAAALSEGYAKGTTPLQANTISVPRSRVHTCCDRPAVARGCHVRPRNNPTPIRSCSRLVGRTESAVRGMGTRPGRVQAASACTGSSASIAGHCRAVRRLRTSKRVLEPTAHTSAPGRGAAHDDLMSSPFQRRIVSAEMPISSANA
jgi:hypothetical protein